MMTNKQIKDQAIRKLGGHWGTGVALTVFKMAFIMAWVVFEMLLFLMFDHLEIEYSFYPAYLVSTHLGRFMTLVRVLMLFFVINPERYILDRIYVDMFSGRNFLETRRYIQHNSRAVHPRATFSMMLPMMLKLIVLSPIFLSIYGIWYWGFSEKDKALTTLGLFVFMICIGFTIVWTGVFVHYCISISLAKYIMLLNPRASVFDACDLSAKIMDGKHGRYISFMLSFAKYIPLIILFYPIFLFEPYFKMCQCAFAEELMGNYWLDKFPAMIQRWNKYAK